MVDITSAHSTVTMKIACDLDECSFISVLLQKKKQLNITWVYARCVGGCGQQWVWLTVGVANSGCSPDSSVLVANRHHMFNLFDALCYEGGQVLNIHTSIGAFLQVKTLLMVLRQKVPYFFLVIATQSTHPMNAGM